MFKMENFKLQQNTVLIFFFSFIYSDYKKNILVIFKKKEKSF